MKILLILALSFMTTQDSTILVYRKGLNKVVKPTEPVKVYKNTPRRKILYTYYVSDLEFKNEKLGFIKNKKIRK